MNPPKKLTSQQRAEEQQQTTGHEQSEAQAAREFASVEEMLRHDALHTPVPPSIGNRLQKSIDQAPPSTSWWRRLFGGSKP